MSHYYKQATQKVQSMKQKDIGSAGIDGVTVEELGSYLYLHKEEIKDQIRNRKYKPMPVKRVELQEQMELNIQVLDFIERKELIDQNHT